MKDSLLKLLFAGFLLFGVGIWVGTLMPMPNKVQHKTTFDDHRLRLREAYVADVELINKNAREGVECGDYSLVERLDADRALCFRAYRDATRDLYKCEGMEPPLWTVDAK